MMIEKDRKGSCWIISHKRCGVTECLFLTEDELVELSVRLRSALGDLDV